jgi:hypothetical protein
MAENEEDIKTIASMDLLFAKFSDLFDDFASGKKGKATEVRNSIRNIKVAIKSIEKNLGLSSKNRAGKEKEFSKDYQFLDSAISRFMAKSPKDIQPLLEIEKKVRAVLLSENLSWVDDSRSSDATIFRTIVAYFARNEGYILEELGSFLDRDHSTIQFYTRKYTDVMENPTCDPKLYHLINLCGDKIL